MRLWTPAATAAFAKRGHRTSARRSLDTTIESPVAASTQGPSRNCCCRSSRSRASCEVAATDRKRSPPAIRSTSADSTPAIRSTQLAVTLFRVSTTVRRASEFTGQFRHRPAKDLSVSLVLHDAGPLPRTSDRAWRAEEKSYRRAQLRELKATVSPAHSSASHMRVRKLTPRHNQGLAKALRASRTDLFRAALRGYPGPRADLTRLCCV